MSHSVGANLLILNARLNETKINKPLQGGREEGEEERDEKEKP